MAGLDQRRASCSLRKSDAVCRSGLHSSLDDVIIGFMMTMTTTAVQVGSAVFVPFEGRTVRAIVLQVAGSGVRVRLPFTGHTFCVALRRVMA